MPNNRGVEKDKWLMNIDYDDFLLEYIHIWVLKNDSKALLSEYRWTQTSRHSMSPFIRHKHNMLRTNIHVLCETKKGWHQMGFAFYYYYYYRRHIIALDEQKPNERKIFKINRLVNGSSRIFDVSWVFRF